MIRTAGRLFVGHNGRISPAKTLVFVFLILGLEAELQMGPIPS